MALSLLTSLFVSFLLVLVSDASPVGRHASLSASLGTRQTQALPLLQLDYGTFQASSYNSDADIYTFTNIRYAVAPIGNLRWRKPQRPLNISGVQDGSQGPPFGMCPQSGATATSSTASTATSSPTNTALFTLVNSATPINSATVTNLPTTTPSVRSPEDCLFLDAYVPGKAIRNPSQYNLPVAVWIHGGTNLHGSKNINPGLLYDGTGPIATSGNDMIVIAGNYRLGALGWLAGDTMEKDGLPNAGLHDQRAIFQWVQDYISLLGGDKTQVAAWGESAGASDIMYQLTAQGGTLDPLFSKAYLQSPAGGTLIDRKGDLVNTFQNFASLAGCGGAAVTLDCLRNASSDSLIAANNDHTMTNGSVSLSADGTYIRQAVELEFASGAYWKNISSMVVTHVADEGIIFVPTSVTSDSTFQSWVATLYPTYAANVTASIVSQYPISRYKTQAARCSDFIRDFAFMDRQRMLTVAYPNIIWKMQYNIAPAVHASDLLALFYNSYASANVLASLPSMMTPVPSYIAQLSAAYQSYAVSFTISGNPNTLASTLASNAGVSGAFAPINWPQPANLTGELMTNVLQANSTGWTVTTDYEVHKSRCDFFNSMMLNVTALGGYAAPSMSLSTRTIHTVKENGGNGKLSTVKSTKTTTLKSTVKSTTTKTSSTSKTSSSSKTSSTSKTSSISKTSSTTSTSSTTTSSTSSSSSSTSSAPSPTGTWASRNYVDQCSECIEG